MIDVVYKTCGTTYDSKKQAVNRAAKKLLTDKLIETYDKDVSDIIINNIDLIKEYIEVTKECN